MTDKFDIVRQEAVDLMWRCFGKASTVFEVEGKKYKMTLEEVE